MGSGHLRALVIRDMVFNRLSPSADSLIVLIQPFPNLLRLPPQFFLGSAPLLRTVGGDLEAIHRKHVPTNQPFSIAGGENVTENRNYLITHRGYEIGYRELWSLLTTRRLPLFDERIRDNTGKSVRNGFIFLVLVLGCLMLPFSTILITEPDTAHILGGLLVSGGIVYMLSYIFYDRVEPKLGKRGLKMLKVFLIY